MFMAAVALLSFAGTMPAFAQPRVSGQAAASDKPKPDPCSLSGDPGTLRPYSAIRTSMCTGAVSNSVLAASSTGLDNVTHIADLSNVVPNVSQSVGTLQLSDIGNGARLVGQDIALLAANKPPYDETIVVTAPRHPNLDWIAVDHDRELAAQFGGGSFYTDLTDYLKIGSGRVLSMIGISALQPYLDAEIDRQLRDLIVGGAESGVDSNPGASARRRDEWLDGYLRRQRAGTYDNPNSY